jgi:RNA polymerase sigma factor (sigma-70 family)
MRLHCEVGGQVRTEIRGIRREDSMAPYQPAGKASRDEIPTVSGGRKWAMAAALDQVLNHLHKLVAAEQASQCTDSQLLQRFAASHDEQAFASLVHRHAAMVLNVCRRVLQNDADAEDACQATFLVLARKARSIRKKDAVGSWLHGVACRAANSLRRQLARRRDRDRTARPLPIADPVAEISWREMRSVLDEAIERLPEKFKGPVLHCLLEGKAHNEAAQQLACSLTTFRGRLERARELLRQTLRRRGITLSGALLAALVPEKAGSAAISPHLLITTVKAGLAGDAAVQGVVPTRVLTLAQGVIQSMFLTKLKALTIVLFLTLGIIVFGSGLHMRQAEAQQDPAGKLATTGQELKEGNEK